MTAAKNLFSIETARQVRRDKSLPAERGLYTAPDGVELYFEDSGGDAPVLFYVYGLGCSYKHWKYPMAHFAADGGAKQAHRQIWMDFRGHGRSQAPLPGTRLSVAQIISDIRALCEHRRIEHATFLGQSMGGSIAVQLAHDHPELVSALVLLAAPGRDPSLSLPLQPLSRGLFRGMIQLNRYAPLLVRLGYLAATRQLANPVVKVAIRELIRSEGFNPALSRTEDIEEYIQKIFEISPNLFYDLAADLAAFDIARLERKVECPTLVVAGAQDHIVPLSETARVIQHLAKGELFLVQHGSHCPHFDDPGLVNRAIEAFLSKNRL